MAIAVVIIDMRIQAGSLKLCNNCEKCNDKRTVGGDKLAMQLVRVESIRRAPVLSIKPGHSE